MRIDNIGESSAANLLVKRGPSLRITSSAGLGWTAVAVERHRVGPGERSEIALPHPVVHLVSGQQVSYGERPDRRGHFMPYTKQPGALNVYSGFLPTMHQATEVEVVACALDIPQPRRFTPMGFPHGVG